MGAVGVRELKNRLTYHLDRAAALETRLARLAALGIVTLPTRKGFGRTRPLRISGPSVSRAILEDRR
jgi:hypothetical protein